MIGTEPAECALQVHVHVGVVGMHLIDNHDFSRHAEMPEHQVFLLQRGHQNLIDRCNDKIGEQYLLAAAEKAVYHQRLIFILADARFPRELSLSCFQQIGIVLI